MTQSTEYTGYSQQYFEELQVNFGAQLQGMCKRAKFTFRAALAVITSHSYAFGWEESSEAREKFIEYALKEIDLEIFEELPQEAEYIVRAASLPIKDIEGLISSLSSQLNT